MCGIAGSFGESDGVIIERMLAKMAHRGPDGTGIRLLPTAALGHARLSIIDLEGGRQPIQNEEGTIWVVVNGEIYNYRSQRAKLQRLGHIFRTDSDSEVILHLYEEMGSDLVHQLHGMFAFALLDCRHEPRNFPNEPRLLLARDPLGIKPLYWSRSDRTIHFASEMKALQIAHETVEEFPPGSLFESGSGIRRYYVIPPSTSEVSDADDAVETLRNVMRESVRRRLVSDVPLGVFLSGGLDSSLIAAMVRELRQEEGDGTPIPSFATGLKGTPDPRYSREVGQYLKTSHHVYEYRAEEVVRTLPEVIYNLESFDPALVRSAVPTYFVSRLAAQHVKVVLSGEGADELFAGYDYLDPLHATELDAELRAVTQALHNTNLQRVDRMTMAHALEGRVPFLDVNVVKAAFRLDLELKRPSRSPSPAGVGNRSKWILRNVAARYLPPGIVQRPKVKFSLGTGTSDVLRAWAEKSVTDADFHRLRRLHDCQSKEELAYLRIFQEFFPTPFAKEAVGRTRSVVPGEIA